MKRIITLDDFIETYTKLQQRGLNFITSKFNLNDIARAKTAFNHSNISAANWWIIPKVTERWHKLITRTSITNIEDFTVKRFLNDQQHIRMLSLGSGDCSSELAFAKHPNFKDILCTDIADKRLNKAKQIAKEKGLNNIRFEIQDANDLASLKETYDIVYFKASLHHFKSIESLLGTHIKQLLKPDGLLIINEYVGPTRLQFPKHQLKAINKALKGIPKPYRKRYKLNLYKNKVYGPGLARMILADPSECIDSASIMPTLHKHYSTVYEVGYGGNILTLALKDIAHHFIELNDEKAEILNRLFEYEDNYLKKHPSDHIFGIYKPNNA
ncbi:class I SAM-dependent methyltransferase [Winogradskyella sp. UBA3174]|uniref:class I SAM-dependent methyltransferase n=1 Tax=Winogradskyella sp. UBA3174 TaxID=1947785 RepID=UPI0025CF0D4C|nr:class I SAM-dependent methyltransferase [Winogradskyella sp. UBA3174]|tara:strand:+ start:27112 stop:28092 length:981 start_codon:yes stop_codon:yes gene_type:complete